MQKVAIGIGIILILNSAAVSITTSLTLGNFLPAIIGVVIISYTLLYKKIKAHTPKYVQILIKSAMALFAATFAFSSFTVYKNSVRIPPDGADAVIVLGAGLNGKDVSLTLAHRLDAAIEYHNKNPESIIVVSGGQGPNEIIPEALAMKNYLTENGIDEKYILMEDKSSRTVENFEFSKDILDKYFNREYTVIYVTNGFHIFRAGMIAEKTGLNAYGLSSESVLWLEPTNYIREYFSLIKYFLLDN